MKLKGKTFFFRFNRLFTHKAVKEHKGIILWFNKQSTWYKQ